MFFIDLIEKDPPSWVDEELKPFEEEWFRQARPFAKWISFTSSGSLNISRLIGTDHPNYKNKSWRWMLSNGKRMESNLESYNRNPDYYFNSDNKSLHYYSLDGKNYFILEGNHRSVIARFALHYKRKTHLHGVNIEKLKIIDKEMLSCYLKLKCFIESELLPFRVDSEPLFLRERKWRDKDNTKKYTFSDRILRAIGKWIQKKIS